MRGREGGGELTMRISLGPCKRARVLLFRGCALFASCLAAAAWWPLTPLTPESVAGIAESSAAKDEGEPAVGLY